MKTSHGDKPRHCRITYLTRKFPPSVGGMESLAATQWGYLAHHYDARLIALTRPRAHLLWFIPWAYLRFAWDLALRRPTHVIVGDGLMYVLIWPLLVISPAHVAVMLHGLDITYPNYVYRYLLRRALRSADRTVANSSATASLLRAIGVPSDSIRILHPGVSPLAPPCSRKATGTQCDHDLPQDRPVIASIGRLVPRKGLAWFIESVLPILPDVILVIAGRGPEEATIREAALRSGVEHRVRLLGSISEECKSAILSAATAFVMPNLKMPHDPEGFGIAAVEAAIAGVPVVAAAVDGLADAIIPDETGFLCPTADARCFSQRIQSLVSDPRKAKEIGLRFSETARQRFGVSAMRDKMPDAFGLPLPG